MSARADIAVLIRAGHSDTSIAARVGCHRATVATARQHLGIPPARVLDRLRAEEAPVPVPSRYREPLSAEQQAANLADLAAAIRRPRRATARDLPSYSEPHRTVRPRPARKAS